MTHPYHNTTTNILQSYNTSLIDTSYPKVGPMAKLKHYTYQLYNDLYIMHGIPEYK